MTLEYTHDTEHPIAIDCEATKLEGLLHIPKSAKAVVLFVHGSGSSRLSPRNQYTARLALVEASPIGKVPG